MNAENIADEIDELKSLLDKLVKAGSPEQRLEEYLKADGCLWRMRAELIELRTILRNGK